MTTAPSMVLMNDFSRCEPALQSAQMAAIARVMESGWLVLGKELAAFEADWARTCGTARAIGVGNGLDAIEIMLRAYGIGQGDEVITTGMTAVATVLGIIRAGATPVLADICPISGLIDPASVERCITPNTRALLPVHLYGRLADIGSLQALAASAEIELFEDCAQSHLATPADSTGGARSIAAAYSFYPTKNLGALGDGGAIVTADQDLADRCARLRNYGQSKRYHHPDIGMNSRLDELQAAVLSVRLDYLQGWTARRQEIAARYTAGIRNPRIDLPPTARTGEHVYHLFVICCAERDDLQTHLAARNVQSLIHYPIPAHQQSSFADIARDPNGLPRTEEHAARCLSLPCHPYLLDDEIDCVIEAVNAFSG